MGKLMSGEMRWNMKSVHILSRRPGNEDAEVLMPGDVVELETVGGWVMGVDPITYKNIDQRQQFEVTDEGLGLKAL